MLFEDSFLCLSYRHACDRYGDIFFEFKMIFAEIFVSTKN